MDPVIRVRQSVDPVVRVLCTAQHTPFSSYLHPSHAHLNPVLPRYVHSPSPSSGQQASGTPSLGPPYESLVVPPVAPTLSHCLPLPGRLPEYMSSLVVTLRGPRPPPRTMCETGPRRTQQCTWRVPLRKGRWESSFSSSCTTETCWSSRHYTSSRSTGCSCRSGRSCASSPLPGSPDPYRAPLLVTGVSVRCWK